MGSPISLLQGARAFARDFARDQMPRGYLWDVADYVPMIIDAGLTGRGGWPWGSDPAAADFESGVLAPFVGGEQLLWQTTDGQVYKVDPLANTLTPLGSTTRSLQNPAFLINTAVSPASDGVSPPALWRSDGLHVASSDHKPAPFAVTYKAMMCTGGAPGEEDVVRFSVPGADLTVGGTPGPPTNGSFDPRSFYPTSGKVTALAALRSAVLIFHAGSTERLRGTTPANGATAQGDMFVEPLFDRIGCVDPRTIAYWNDNCIFADEHGVHITDGAVIRNLCTQGAIHYLWRMAYQNKISMAGQVFMDYYLITLRTSTAPPLTLVCDLNSRQWFRFTNIDSTSYVASSGSIAMERMWAAIAGTSRLARIGPIFFPALTGASIQDANGAAVLPMFQTPWYRLAQEGRKRTRFVYLSYDVRTSTRVQSDLPADWRREYGDQDGGGILDLPSGIATPGSVASTLQVGYITSPQDTSYTIAGALPSSAEYTRYRLPVGKGRYGLAFQVTQLAPSTVTRIFDLAVESWTAERSRV